MSVLVELQDVSVTFEGKKNVLNNINIRINEGELISLIGANGSGKSTLLQTLVGLITPTQGKVVRNVDNIFYVPQAKDLDTSFPLNVEEFCRLYGGDDFLKFLERMKIEKKLKSKMSDLSGGEYQRVVMAIALSRRSPLLLLDEPTSGIDIVGEKTFYRLISDVQREYGISIIVVSHNINMVLDNTDKVMCLSHGVCHVDKPTKMKNSDVFKDVFGDHLIPYIHHHEHSA